MARYIDADKINYTTASIYWGKDKDGKDIYRRTAIAIESEIDELPTADVEEVKHAEWIETKEWYFDEYAQSDYQRKCYKCSRCGRTEKYKEQYCHCGAKMDRSVE